MPKKLLFTDDAAGKSDEADVPVDRSITRSVSAELPQIATIPNDVASPTDIAYSDPSMADGVSSMHYAIEAKVSETTRESIEFKELSGGPCRMIL